MIDVALVSTPLGAPWNNGSKTLVWALAEHLTRKWAYQVMVHPGQVLPQPGIRAKRVHPGTGQNRRVLTALLGTRAKLSHFFFAPHRTGARAARAACLLNGSTPVQTVCSQPETFDDAEELCFGQKVVVLSEWTQRRFMEAGVPRAQLLRIPPPLPPGRPVSPERIKTARTALDVADEDAIILFAGDAEPRGGLMTFVSALCEMSPGGHTVGVVACRPKQKTSQRHLGHAERLAAGRGHKGKVRFTGQVGDFPALLAAASLVVLPASSLYTKVDYPYVVLEAMAMGIPAVVSGGTAMEELSQGGSCELAAPNAPTELAEVMTRLMADPNGRKVLGSKGAALVSRLCDPRKVAAEYEKLHGALI